MSQEDREVFDWIGKILQDVHDGKNVYLTDEEVERDRQEWLKTQKPVAEEKKSFSSPCQQEDAEQEMEQGDKDEDEVGEEPDEEND